MQFLLRISLFRIFPSKWRIALLISYGLFLITFTTGVILSKFYPSPFSTVIFWLGLALCVIHVGIKLFAYYFNKINIFFPWKNSNQIKN